jgi:hypothetical protein
MHPTDSEDNNVDLQQEVCGNYRCRGYDFVMHKHSKSLRFLDPTIPHTTNRISH